MLFYLYVSRRADIDLSVRNYLVVRDKRHPPLFALQSSPETRLVAVPVAGRLNSRTSSGST